MGNNHSSMPRIHTFTIFSEIPRLDAIPDRTTIGPVWEVQVVKILDGYGIEVAIPSIANPANTSYVVISRETKRFVNEIHDHKEFRSSNELLTTEKGSNSSKEHGALNSFKESFASALSNLIGERSERKWMRIEAHKDGSSLRSGRTWRKWIISLGAKSLLQRICTGKSKRFFWRVVEQGSSKPRTDCCLENKKSICYSRDMGHSGGIPIRPDIMEHTLIPHTTERSAYFTEEFRGSLVPGRKENDKARQVVFFTPLNPFGTDPRCRETSRWSHCSSKSTLPNLLETQSICSSDQADEGKSMCLCWSRSMCWTDEGQSKSNRKMEKSSVRTEVVFVLPRCSGNRWRSNWIRVEIFPWIFIVVYSSWDPERLGERENIQSSPKSSRTESSSCQCSMTLSGKRMMRIVFRVPRKSRITRWKSRKDIRHSWVRGRKRSGMGNSSYTQKGELGFCSRRNGTAIQRNLTSSFPTCQCIETRNLEAKER